MRDSVDHLVIGGGPAGAMLALRLAATGREVMLLEKEHEPHHKVCGEFLSPEALEYLRRIGVQPLDLGAQVIHNVRLHSSRQTIESRLPFEALSLSRRILDQILLERAGSGGCSVLRGIFVEKLQMLGTGWLAQLRGGRTVNAKTVFLATGKHDLGSYPRSSGTQSDLVGFKMHWKLDRTQAEALCGCMELFLFRDGYGGLSMVENGISNFCFVVRRKRLRELGGWSELLNAIQHEVPAIARRLGSGTPCWTKPLAISPIPYGHLGGTANALWRIGDQAAVIPSFTGDGMSIALHSAELAAEMYLEGATPDDYLHRLENQLHFGMRFASALSKTVVSHAGRTIIPLLLARVPQALGHIARITRIPDTALNSLRESNTHFRPSSATLA